jgi:hypothetical protein
VLSSKLSTAIHKMKVACGGIFSFAGVTGLTLLIQSGGGDSNEKIPHFVRFHFTDLMKAKKLSTAIHKMKVACGGIFSFAGVTGLALLIQSGGVIQMKKSSLRSLSFY